MTFDVFTLGVALVASVLITTCWRLRRRREREADDWLPHPLRSTRLAYAERVFRSKGPIRISARVDQAYRDGRGHLTLVELKTRDLDRVYDSDVIELSAQRAALTVATGETVHREAYVLVQGTVGRRRRVHRVALLTVEQVAALAERRQALLSGATQPRRTCIEGICDYCAFVGPCRGPR